MSERFPLIALSASMRSSSNTERRTASLRRSVGYSQLFAYVVSILIGSCLYISPRMVAKYSSNMAIALEVWILSGIISLFGALCFYELAISLKKTGGYYIYIKEAYGDLAGFIAAWTTVVVINPSGLALISVTFGEHAVGAFADITSPNGIWMVKGISALLMLWSFVTNIVSTSFTNKTLQFLTFFQILSIVFFIGVGVWKCATSGVQNYSDMFATNDTMDYKGLSVAIYIALWSYGGWGFIVSATEELTNAEKDLWLAIVTGIPFVILCYVSINLAFMSVLSHTDMASFPLLASRFIEKALGKNFGLIVPFIVAINCFGCLNSSNFFLARTVLSAAREGHLPKPLSYIHKVRLTPVVALLFMLSTSLVWILLFGTGTEILITCFSFGVWIVYGLALSATIVLRVKQPELPRPAKVWIANPIFMCLVSAFLVLVPLFKQPVDCGICLLVILLSIPVYFVVLRSSVFAPSSLRRYKEHMYKLILQRLGLAVCAYVEEDEESESKVAEDETMLFEPKQF